MFSLLNPAGLWLGALIAVPLVIHFLGRQRLRRQPFPSLLLVKERFSRSMNRHRLKNLLLLILRTLLVACVLLALANPALESRKAVATKVDASLALIHNGIYGRIPVTESRGIFSGAGGDAVDKGRDALEAQRLRLRALDSASGTHTLILPLIADGPGATEVSERFGDYGEAAERLAAAAGKGGTAQWHIPVFAWTDLEPAKAALLRALQDNPGLEIALTDYSGAAGKVDAFAGMKAAPSADAPTAKLDIALAPDAPSSSKVQVELNGRLFQEAAATGGHAEVTLPLGEGPRTFGKLSLPKSGFAVSDLYFCFPQAGAWELAHSGSTLTSLPSLGRESYFRRIVHVASAKDIPWGGGKDGAKLRLVYLAGERAVSPDVYARAVEFVRDGGRLIIGVGKDSDVPSLNRFLLQPLRLGRLGSVVDANGPVSADRKALARLALPSEPGALGAVRKRFSFAPDSGTEAILTQASNGGPAEAVLSGRDFHRGQALLWTTDLDDLDWTDIGVSPVTPLLHRAFQAAGAEDRAANVEAASDSVFAFNVDAESGAAPSVSDPEGRAFTKVRRDGARLRIGPFDRLGLHRIVVGADTTVFAVNLAQRDGEDRKARDTGARAAFLKDFKPYHGRLQVLSADQPALARSSVRRLWPAFVLAAILLLFLEGLISATFSLKGSRP